jgi:hypothetical protein
VLPAPLVSARRVDAIDPFFVPPWAAHRPSTSTRLAVTTALGLGCARLLALLVARLSLATLPTALLTLLATLPLLLGLPTILSTALLAA